MDRPLLLVILALCPLLLIPQNAQAGKGIIWIAEKAQSLPVEPALLDPSTWLPWLLTLLGL